MGNFTAIDLPCTRITPKADLLGRARDGQAETLESRPEDRVESKGVQTLEHRRDSHDRTAPSAAIQAEEGAAGLANYPGEPVAEGAKGETVRKIQEQLKKAGLDLQADGDFGPITARSVREFQSRNGLAETGAVDQATWDKLFGQNSGGANGAPGDAVPRPDDGAPAERSHHSDEPDEPQPDEGNLPTAPPGFGAAVGQAVKLAAPRAALPAAVAVNAYNVANAFTTHGADSPEFRRSAAAAGGSIAGGLAGAQAGAAIGLAVGGPAGAAIGTAIGAIVGSGLAGYAAGEIEERLEELLPDLADGISNAVDTLGDWVGNVGEAIGDGAEAITGFAKEGAERFGDVLGDIGGAFGDAWDAAGDLFGGILEGAGDLLEGLNPF